MPYGKGYASIQEFYGYVGHPPSVTGVPQNPDQLPLPLAKIKDQLSLTDSTLDDQLRDYILEATEELETDIAGYLRPTTVTEVYDWRLGLIQPHSSYDYRHSVLPLRRWPVTSFTKLDYIDPDGASQEWDASNYETDLSSIPSRLRLLSALPALKDTMQAVTLTYEASYQQIPRVALAAIKERVVFKFEQRDGVLRMGSGSTHQMQWEYAVRQLSWGVPS